MLYEAGLLIRFRIIYLYLSLLRKPRLVLSSIWI
nr:MAG TPA: hypothetical protein [Caudoviricetes sp.]